MMKLTCQAGPSYYENRKKKMLFKISESIEQTVNLYKLKSYLRYKTITSQNLLSEAQVKNFFVS